MITTVCKISYGSQTVPPIVSAVQGDTGRAISFEIADFTPPAGATATYFILKPSGEAIYNSATITDNSILCELTAQSLAEAGENRMQVRVLQGENIVTSFEVILMVRTFLGDDAMESGTEMNIFDQAVAAATDQFQDNAEQIVEEVIESIPADYTALTEEVDELNERIDNIEPGLSEDAKQALLACFENVRWVGNDGLQYYDALESALYPQTGLVSISAVFAPGETIIYTDTPLDSLKAFLTVTGVYSDGSTRRVYSYSLTGTLAEGQSTITVTSEGKTTTFTVTVVNALDRIAYGNSTYRDLFITNNFIKIGNFDDVTISTDLQTLPNGDTYKINNGSPTISQEAAITGESSLKVTIDALSSQVNYKSTRMPATATFLMAACVRVDEYTSGNVGMQVNVSNAGLSGSMIGHTTKASTTDGFEEIVAVGSYTYDPTSYPDANLNIFIGDYTQGRATGYIDACIATIVPSGITLQEATQLYHDYIQMVKS